MNVRIILGDDFIRHFKRLSKKYKSLPKDYLSLSAALHDNPLLGNDLGNESVWPSVQREKARAAAPVS